MMYTTADTYIIGVILAISSILSPQLTTGHYILITNDTVKAISDDFNQEIRHRITTEFPHICRHVPTDCQPFLMDLDNEQAKLFIPSVDLTVQRFHPNTTIAEFSNEILGIKKCFRYFPTGKRLNELYALCLVDHPHETTVVTYKLKVIGDVRIEPRLLGYGYGTHIDLDSPLIVTFSDSTGPIVLYITNIDDLDKLVIKEINAGGDVYENRALPSNCAGPYELKHFYQLNALLKCHNGLIYFYNGDIVEFTQLPVQDITMVECCTNSTSSVMVTSRDILFNKTANEPLIRIPFLKITINSVQQLNAISFFTCHFNGTATNFYFAVLQDDGMVYLSIPLEYVAKSNIATEPRQLADHEPFFFNTVQSNIEGSAWVTKLIDNDQNIQTTLLIDINTGNVVIDQSSDLTYVLPLESTQHVDFQDDSQPSGDTQPSKDSQSSSPDQSHIFIIIASVIAGVIITTVIIAITLLLLYYKNRRHSSRQQQRSYSMIQADQQLAETSFTAQTDGQAEHSIGTDQIVHDPPVDQNSVTSHAADQGNHHQIATDDYPPASDDHDDNQRLANDRYQYNQSGSVQSLVPATSETVNEHDTPPQVVVPGTVMPIREYINLRSTDQLLTNSNNRDNDDDTEVTSNNN